LSKGDIVAVDMSPADRASAAKVLAKLKPFGVSLELVVSEWIDAKTRLGSVTISRCVDSYLKRFPQNMPSKMVKEVVEEMIAVKRADKLSDRYIKQLEYNMNRFMGRFKNRLLDVGGTDVDAWLRELNVGPRTRNNLRNSVQALFNYAIARKYLPKDHDEIDAVPMAKDRGGEIEIYTPAEMRELLSVASDEHVPFLAITSSPISTRRGRVNGLSPWITDSHTTRSPFCAAWMATGIFSSWTNTPSGFGCRSGTRRQSRPCSPVTKSATAN
jgi:hypothetical protein